MTPIIGFIPSPRTGRSLAAHEATLPGRHAQLHLRRHPAASPACLGRQHAKHFKKSLGVRV